MYWPVQSARRIHLSPSGLHRRPEAEHEEALAEKALQDAAGPPTGVPWSTAGSSSSSKEDLHAGDGGEAGTTGGARSKRASRFGLSGLLPGKLLGGEADNASTEGSASEPQQDPSISAPPTPLAPAANPEIYEQLIDIARSRSGTHYATLSAHTLAVWSVRPTQALAALRRTRRSVLEYGENRRVHWKADGSGLVIEVSHPGLHECGQEKPGGARWLTHFPTSAP